MPFSSKMINGSMAALPAALTGQLGMTLQSHQNINHQLSQLSAFGISGGRSRMPDAHVEMLLDCYKAVQEERTLDSGRLGKGAFHQVSSTYLIFVKLTTNVLFTCFAQNCDLWFLPDLSEGHLRLIWVLNIFSNDY